MKQKKAMILLMVLFLTAADVTAQQMSEKEIKAYICSHHWFLRRYEMNEQMFTVPKEYQGTHMVFLPEGKLYYFKEGDNQRRQKRYDWKLSGNRISFTTHEGDTGSYDFRLEDFIGYKINITVRTGDFKGLNYVWEEIESK